MRRTLLTLLSKRITIPQLSPTHTRARILRFEIKNGTEVSSYDPIVILQCSPDLVTEAFRDRPDQKLRMVVDTQDEGIVGDLNDHGGEWIECGTEIGRINDGEELDGDWTWQAYVDDNGDGKGEGGGGNCGCV